VKSNVALVVLVFVREKVVAPAVVNDSDLTNRTKQKVFFFVVGALLKSRFSDIVQ
jgi:uncharacterized membrane protein